MLNVIGEVAKRIPWAKIGEVALTATAATITALVNRRNQERTIEMVSSKLAKKLIEKEAEMKS